MAAATTTPMPNGTFTPTGTITPPVSCVDPGAVNLNRCHYLGGNG
jgi:hypothetical protein